MMESELSLRGRVGNIQMLPLLLLLTSVNAQFLPVRDYQNNGQDEYLDYLDYRGEAKQALAPVPAPNLNIRGESNLRGQEALARAPRPAPNLNTRGGGNGRVEAQLGDRAPNLNIRGEGNALAGEVGNNPCLLDPTGCYLEIQRLRAALNSFRRLNRAAYQRPSLSANPCTLDPTGCYGK